MHLASCAQWIRHRPMEPGIAASSPAEVIFPSSRLRVVSLCQTTAHNQVIFPSSRLRAVSLHGPTAHSQLGCYCGTLTTTRNVPFSPSKTPRASLSLPLKCCVIHTKRVSSVPHSETCWGSCAHCIKKLKNAPSGNRARVASMSYWTTHASSASATRHYTWFFKEPLGVLVDCGVVIFHSHQSFQLPTK